MRSGEQRRKTATLGQAEERRPLRTDRVKHREHVVDLLFEGRKVRRSVRKPRAAHVEDDQTGERREPAQESFERRFFPLMLDVAEGAGKED